MFGGCIAFSYLAYCLGLSSDNGVCRAMVNNVFLAYLPVEMSFHVSHGSFGVVRSVPLPLSALMNYSDIF